MNEYSRTETDSQGTNQWLPMGGGGRRNTIEEADKGCRRIGVH